MSDAYPDWQSDLIHWKDDEVTEFYVDLVAERHWQGASLLHLASEIGITETDLEKHLLTEGLLEPIGDPDLVQLPHREIIECYEGGMTVERIVAVLKKQNLTVDESLVEAALDHGRVIRHARIGEVPKGAPQGHRSRPARRRG